MKTFATALLATYVASFETVELDNGTNGWASIQITEDGKPLTLYVASDAAYATGSEMILPFNARAYLSKSASLDPTQFYTPNLLGGSVEYDTDLSDSVCGCISAFYMVSMPGKDTNGNYWNTDGYYYCDANQVGGNYCPEFDIMEANQWAYQTTPHSCNAADWNGHYDYCNRSGSCWQNNKNVLDYNAYGPGDGFRINTLKPFHTKLDFNKSGDQFGNFSTTMTQGGNSINMTGDCGTNAEMTDDIRNGMAFAISNWGTMDNWLWGDRCQAQTCNNTRLTFTNIAIKLGSDQPGPDPTPDNYSYGDSCASSWDDDCNGSCDCRWSWPTNEDWSGPDAHCRCKY